MKYIQVVVVFLIVLFSNPVLAASSGRGDTTFIWVYALCWLIVFLPVWFVILCWAHAQDEERRKREKWGGGGFIE